MYIVNKNRHIKTLIFFLLIIHTSMDYSMEILPKEIWPTIFFKTLLECNSIAEAKQTISNWALINKQTNDIKDYFFTHNNPAHHIAFITNLYENSRDISKKEIAALFNLNDYIKRGDTLIHILEDVTLEPNVQLEKVRSMIETQGADVNYSHWLQEECNAPDMPGEFSPLWYAQDNPLVFFYLLKQGAHPDQSRDFVGNTILHELCKKINSIWMTPPCAQEAKKKEPNYKPFFTKLPDQIKKLIKAGADQNAYNANGRSVHKQLFPDLRKWLYAENVLATDSIVTNNYEVDYKVLYTAKPLSKINRYNSKNLSAHYILRNTLGMAANKNKLSILINLQIEKGGLNKKDYNRSTLLHEIINEWKHSLRNDQRFDWNTHTLITYSLADITCCYDLAKTLIENGAPVNVQNGCGHTALDLALLVNSQTYKKQQKDMIQLLRDNGGHTQY